MCLQCTRVTRQQLLQYIMTSVTCNTIESQVKVIYSVIFPDKIVFAKPVLHLTTVPHFICHCHEQNADKVVIKLLRLPGDSDACI